MAVNLSAPIPQDLHPVPGVRLGIAMAGMRKAGRRDLTVICPRRGRPGGGGVHAEPLLRRAGAALPQAPGGRRGHPRAARQHRQRQRRHRRRRAWRAPRPTCAALARHLGLAPAAGAAVLDRRDHGVAAGRAHHRPACRRRWPIWPRTTGPQAAEAIMTTDTVPKAASRQVRIDGRTVTVTGIGKGAGMIRPNMATMLGFVATDAAVDAGAAARAGEGGGRPLVQPHHDRRRHLDQRLLRADRQRRGRQRADRAVRQRRRRRCCATR